MIFTAGGSAWAARRTLRPILCVTVLYSVAVVPALAALSAEELAKLAPGRHAVEFDFKYEGIGAGTLAFNDFSGLAQPGTGTLKVDGKAVATKKMPKTLPMILQWDESFDIGSDTLTGVNDADYKPPFPLTAKLNKLTINVNRPQLSAADIKKLEAAMKEKAKSD
jgi:arylsulfatase